MCGLNVRCSSSVIPRYLYCFTLSTSWPFTISFMALLLCMSLVFVLKSIYFVLEGLMYIPFSAHHSTRESRSFCMRFIAVRGFLLLA